MAKIIFVADHVSPTLKQLASSLTDLKYTVLLLLSREVDASQLRADLNFASHSAKYDQLEIWTYFKSWSLLEALKVLPRVLTWRPDTVHFFFEGPHANLASLAMMKALSPLPHCIIGCSYLRSDLFSTPRALSLKANLQRSFTKQVLSSADILTLPNLQSLQQLKGKSFRAHQLRTLLPPLLSLESQDKRGDRAKNLSSVSESARHEPAQSLAGLILPFEPKMLLKDSWKEWQVVPLEQNRIIWLNRDIFSLAQKKLLQQQLLECDLETRVQVLGLHSKDFKTFLSQSKDLVLCLAKAKLSAEDMSFYMNLSFNYAVPAILNEGQAAQYSQLLQNGKNVWVIPQQEGLQVLWALLDKNAGHLQLPELKDNLSIAQSRFLDTMSNELNRLYTKARDQKAIHSF